MLELLQWGAIFVLGAGVGFLIWGRRDPGFPDWLREISEEDLVIRPDLDSYHHRVVQLSRTQQELLETRSKEIMDRVLRLEKRFSGNLRVSAEGEGNRRDFRSPSDDAEVSVSTEESLTGAVIDDEDLRNEFLDPPDEQEQRWTDLPEPESGEPGERDLRLEQVLRAWDEGMSVDRIARELRMGRQEVQLLIQMSRGRLPARRGV